MKLTICGRFEVPDFAGKGITHMISIGDHDDFFDGLRLPEIDETHHLCLRFTDTHKASHPDAPNSERLQPLVDWLQEAESVDGLLVHCAAGISRSPAVAALALCYLFPESDPLENMEKVAASAQCSHIWPNTLTIETGDQLLGRGGAIIKGIDTWRFRQDDFPFDFS